MVLITSTRCVCVFLWNERCRVCATHNERTRRFRAANHRTDPLEIRHLKVWVAATCVVSQMVLIMRVGVCACECVCSECCRVCEPQRTNVAISGGNPSYGPSVRSGTSKCGLRPHAWCLKWCSSRRHGVCVCFFGTSDAAFAPPTTNARGDFGPQIIVRTLCEIRHLKMWVAATCVVFWTCEIGTIPESISLFPVRGMFTCVAKIFGCSISGARVCVGAFGPFSSVH
jgi:hypothetical protein